MGDKVYVCLKMSKKTLEVEATHQFEKSEIPYSLTSDGTHLYAGMYSYPGKIAKISKQTMGLDKLLTLKRCLEDSWDGPFRFNTRCCTGWLSLRHGVSRRAMLTRMGAPLISTCAAVRATSARAFTSPSRSWERISRAQQLSSPSQT